MTCVCVFNWKTPFAKLIIILGGSSSSSSDDDEAKEKGYARSSRSLVQSVVVVRLTIILRVYIEEKYAEGMCVCATRCSPNIV